MHLQKPTRAALVLALTLSLASPAWAEKTLWLVRPLYPGQETLVERTEKALDKLMPGDARKDSVIGKSELAGALKAQVVSELPCFSADNRCADPIDPFVANLGFERIVLIQGGQDEAGFKYRVVAYEPNTGKVNPATASNANLEKALLGALAKVVPAASTLDVKSNPSGATVFVDDVKVGVTPLNTQVLPGERVIRLDLKLHQPLEETIVIPIRGAASLEKTLEKVAARIVITASPPGTEIFIDGAAVGKDKVDRGIVPGEHVIRLTAEKHKAFEQTISVKADQQYSLDKTLEPLPGAVVKDTPPGKDDKVAVLIKNSDPPAPPPPPPPKPATQEDLIYERRSYFLASFEYGQLLGDGLVGRSYNFDRSRTTSFASAGRSLVGASIEYGTFGKYFGLTVFGLSYLTNTEPWTLNVGYPPGGSCPTPGTCGPTQLDGVRAHLVILRALQVQLRVALWRFQLGLQAGLEFRSGQISGGSGAPPFFRDGFAPIHLMGAVRLNARFFVADGVFIHVQGAFSPYLLGERATDDGGGDYGSPHSLGFNGGVGYAY